MKKKWLGEVLLVVLAIASSPAIALVETYEPKWFGLEAGEQNFIVRSTVELLPTGGIYRYTYEVSSLAHSVSWFSVGLDENSGLTGMQGRWGTASFEWTVMGSVSDPISYDALFPPQVAGVYTMFFDSTHAPAIGDAMVGGRENRQYYTLIGDVWTPAPEPTSMALFVLGLGLLAKKKRA